MNEMVSVNKLIDIFTFTSLLFYISFLNLNVIFEAAEKACVQDICNFNLPEFPVLIVLKYTCLPFDA